MLTIRNDLLGSVFTAWGASGMAFYASTLRVRLDAMVFQSQSLLDLSRKANNEFFQVLWFFDFLSRIIFVPE